MSHLKSIHCFFFLTAFLMVTSLSAAEVKLLEFQGTPGRYLAIPDLKIGPVNDPCLVEKGVELNILQIDHPSGEIRFEYEGKEIEKFDILYPPNASEPTRTHTNTSPPAW